MASVLTDAVEASPEFRAKLVECMDALDSTFARRFEQARRSGDLPDDVNIEALAQIFVSFSQGLTLRARSGASLTRLRIYRKSPCSGCFPARLVWRSDLVLIVSFQVKFHLKVNDRGAR